MTEEVTETPEVPETEEKPKGYDPVDLEKTALTDEQKEALQDRLNYLYKQVKTNQGFVEEARDHNTKLSEALDRQNKRLTELESADGERSLNSIKAEIAEATEIGDTDRVVELTDQLIDMKTAQKEPEEPKNIAEPQTMSIEDQHAVSRWAGETTDDGNLARPWLNPAHPDSPKVQAVANEIINDPDWKGKTLNEQLAEVDRRMAGKTAAAPPVMSSTGRPKRKEKATLTEEEKHVARKLGVSEEAYLKQKEAINA